MSSSVIRLAYVALRRRAEARRSGGITLHDLDPGPHAAEAIAEALHKVAEPGECGPQTLASVTANPPSTPETQSMCQAPLHGAALVEVDTITGAGAIPSSVTLTQRVAVARDVDTGGTVPVQYGLLEGRSAATRNEIAIRALNVAIAVLFLLVAFPLLLLIAGVVKLTSPGPVLYKQVRVGLDRRRQRQLAGADRRQRADRRTSTSAVTDERRTGKARRTGSADRRLRQVLVMQERRSGSDRRQWNLCGRMFTMYKFRTMRLDAESSTGAVWAGKSDPRVTPVGRVLRACRLDELPQLYNVLKGDMNIVGPRPERPTIVVDLVNAITEYPIRQRTLPGITGLAQISQGPDGSVDDVRVKVSYDLEYLRRRSVLEDLRIMAKTPAVMFLKRTGR
jgi:lipopolysaccharide/colanic/teichoic acid biosynthesis glycosyltransferase